MLSKLKMIFAQIMFSILCARHEFVDLIHFKINQIKLINPNRYGIYPLTAYVPKQPPPCRPRAISPETAESVKSVTPEPIDVEARRVVNMMCSVKPREDGCELLVSICVRLFAAIRNY